MSYDVLFAIANFSLNFFTYAAGVIMLIRQVKQSRCCSIVVLLSLKQPYILSPYNSLVRLFLFSATILSSEFFIWVSVT